MHSDLRYHHLHDEALLEEIELLTTVIIAATLSPDSLCRQQVDEMLGLTVPDDGGALPRQRDGALSTD